MRLNSLKLAGFKSFVDTTTLVFPDNRTAVVGPNGCGKSNVIDAIRWVMGESSARQLRGGAMTDVIFAGTSQRKPVGQASVELRFENTLGKLGGEYNAYTELAVRRQVNRDGRSDYFLNGTRCRRRDITDIFLGTGLGPRSYAIIEQGMINRLVDAKPEDMRVFIEEAAGVSRYQARRRETLQHLEHTRQNLGRLQDINDELQSQIRSLKRQSQAAIKYRELEQQRRDLTIALWSSHYAIAENTQQQHTQHLTKLGEQYRLCRSQRGQADADWQTASQLLAELVSKAEPLQQAWQQAERELTQLQAGLQQGERDQQQRDQQIHQWQQTLHRLNEQMVEDQQQFDILTITLADTEQTLEPIKNSLLSTQQALTHAENIYHDKEQQLEKIQHQQHQLERTQQQLQQRIAANSQATLRLEQQILHTNEQLDRLQQQQPQDELNDVVSVIDELNLQQITLEQQQTQQQAVLQQRQSLLEQVNQQIKQIHSELQQLQLEQAALIKIQLKPKSSKQHHLVSSQSNTLIQQLIIQPPAQAHIQLIEKFLGDWLNAELQPDFNSLGQQARSYINILDANSQQEQASTYVLNHPDITPLSMWIQPVLSCWHAVGMVDNYQTAIALQHHLNASQSLLTLDGFWLGRDWQINLNIDEQASRQHGILQQQIRLQELKQLTEQLSMQQQPLLQQQTQQQTDYDVQKDHLCSIDQQLKQIGQQQAKLNIQRARLESTLQASQQQISQLIRQQTDLQHTLQDDQSQLSDWHMELAGINIRLNEVLPKLQDEQHELVQIRQAVQAAQALHQTKQQQYQQLQNSLQTMQLQHHNLQNALGRAQPQQQHIEQQLNQLIQINADAKHQYPEQLEQLEFRQQQAENTHQLWSQWQKQLEFRQQEQQRLNQLRQQEQINEDHLRDQLEQTRLKWQDCKNKMEQAREQLITLDAEPTKISSHTSAHLSNELNNIQEQLEKVQQQLQKLGQLNLAAPEALQEVSERQAELEHQMTDLHQTVEQLENAMHSIDQQTRSLFMSTFDQVNSELKILFPKVFGGGEASLSLEDNWQSGVRLIARPPGKRNSTLALLSGGEKALTALALVFAIFRLNPAPFCVLDEVDAPLDDANVQRFCHLVKELSQQVQFIYITHNKLAMTMATDLLGVTMPEPGASRLVAVNIEQAAKFSATSE